MASNREPIYLSNNYRVVSRPNGSWRAEHRRGEGTREADPWHPLTRDTSFEEAFAHLRGVARSTEAT